MDEHKLLYSLTELKNDISTRFGKLDEDMTFVKKQLSELKEDVKKINERLNMVEAK